MLTVKKNLIPVFVILNSVMPYALRAKTTLSWPSHTLFQVMSDVKKIGNNYTQLLIKKITSLPQADVSEEIIQKANHIKNENLTLQIISTGVKKNESLDPHKPLHIYLSKIGTPKVPAIDLGTINPTTETNRFKKPQTLLLEVIKGIDTHLKINNLRIPRFDKFRYSVISSFNKYDPLSLDSKFPFKINDHYHYLDVAQVKTLLIGMSPMGDITINGLQPGDDMGTPLRIKPLPKEYLLFVKQDGQHPDVFEIHSQDGNAGTWFNIKKKHPGTNFLKPFPTISEALAQ